MKHLFIMVDLAKNQVVKQSNDFDDCMKYERENQEKALYLIKVGIDELYPCVRALEGVAY